MSMVNILELILVFVWSKISSINYYLTDTINYYLLLTPSTTSFAANHMY
jgi:hypothetical protein